MPSDKGSTGHTRWLTCAKGLYLFPHHPTSYILLLTSGKAFSNLPEHTWTDYNKMAPALPSTKQSPLPIPPVPQLPAYSHFSMMTPQPPVPVPIMQQPIQGQLPQQHRPNCCPPGSGGNCCPPTSGMQTMQMQNHGMYYGGAGAWYTQTQQVGYASGSSQYGGAK